jgi:hypothetical protein
MSIQTGYGFCTVGQTLQWPRRDVNRNGATPAPRPAHYVLARPSPFDSDTLITHRFNGEHPELEAERLVQKRAYFIDDTVPTPDKDAGSNAAAEHMRLLMDLGYKVVFLPADNMSKIDPYTAQLHPQFRHVRTT